MAYKIKKYIYVEKHTSKFLSIPHTLENKKVKFFKENYALKQSDRFHLKLSSYTDMNCVHHFFLLSHYSSTQSIP